MFESSLGYSFDRAATGRFFFDNVPDFGAENRASSQIKQQALQVVQFGLVDINGVAHGETVALRRSESLLAPRRRIGLLVDAAGRQATLQHLQNERFEFPHAESRYLQDEHIGIPVHYQTRDAVCFRIDNTIRVCGPRHPEFALRERRVEVGSQSFIRRRIAETDHAADNGAAPVEMGTRQEGIGRRHVMGSREALHYFIS